MYFATWTAFNSTIANRCKNCVKSKRVKKEATIMFFGLSRLASRLASRGQTRTQGNRMVVCSFSSSQGWYVVLCFCQLLNWSSRFILPKLLHSSTGFSSTEFMFMPCLHLWKEDINRRHVLHGRPTENQRRSRSICLYWCSNSRLCRHEPQNL